MVSRVVPFLHSSHFLFCGTRRAQHGRRSSTRQAPSSRSAIYGPSDAHDAQLSRLRLRDDVHRRCSALAKAAAAQSDVDVGGGRRLAPYANDGCSRRGCTGSAYHCLRHSVVRVSRPPASRAAPGGQAASLSCCGHRGRLLPTSSPSCRRRSHRSHEASDAAIFTQKVGVEGTPHRLSIRAAPPLAWPPFHAKPTAEPACPTPSFARHPAQVCEFCEYR